MSSYQIFGWYWIRFYMWYEDRVQLHSLHLDSQCPSTTSLKRLFSLSWMISEPCQKSVNQWYMDLFLDSQFYSFHLYAYLYYNTTLFWFLYLYCKLWDWEVWDFHLFFFKIALTIWGPLLFHIILGSFFLINAKKGSWK